MLLFLLKEPFTVIVNFLVNLAFVAKLYFQFLDVFVSVFGDKDVAQSIILQEWESNHHLQLL